MARGLNYSARRGCVALIADGGHVVERRVNNGRGEIVFICMVVYKTREKDNKHPLPVDMQRTRIM